jgi:tetratricopeptide (TPR) repeat protein
MDSKSFEHLMSLQSPEEVIRESQNLLTQRPDVNEKASLLGNIHVSLVKLGRLEEAKKILEELKRLEILDIEMRLIAEFWEPCFLVQDGRPEEALSAFSAILERNCVAFKNPEHRYLYEDIQCRRATVLFDLSNYKDALPILHEAAECFSFDDPADRQLVHFQLGVCLYYAGNMTAAKEDFLLVLRLNLGNEYEERSLYWLGTIYYKNGASAQTIHHLETLLRDFPAVSAAVRRDWVYELLSKAFRYLGDEVNGHLYANLAKEAGNEASEK